MSVITSYCHIRNNKILKGGEIFFERPGILLNDFLSDSYMHLGGAYPKFYKMDKLSKLGFLGSEILLKDLPKKYSDAMAVVLSNSNSSLDTDMRYWDTVKSNASPSLFVYTLPNIVAGEICIRHGIKGESILFVSEKFDPVLLFDYVEMIFNSGRAAYCLTGWVDVLDDRCDVFLYLVQKNDESGTEHNASGILELYLSWNN